MKTPKDSAAKKQADSYWQRLRNLASERSSRRIEEEDEPLNSGDTDCRHESRAQTVWKSQEERHWDWSLASKELDRSKRMRIKKGSWKCSCCKNISGKGGEQSFIALLYIVKHSLSKSMCFHMTHVSFRFSFVSKNLAQLDSIFLNKMGQIFPMPTLCGCHWNQ